MFDFVVKLPKAQSGSFEKLSKNFCGCESAKNQRAANNNNNLNLFF